MSSAKNEVDAAFAEMLYSMAFGWSDLGTPELRELSGDLSFKGKIRMFLLDIRAVCSGEACASYEQALGYLEDLKIPEFGIQDRVVLDAMSYIADSMWTIRDGASQDLAEAVGDVIFEIRGGRYTAFIVFKEFIERNNHV